ncbi:MAG TPA: type ISP restriction/modification enzyme [Solimonas sp.]|nr:type ISP restriction/modification enzyme [Solimonas sp.]
MTEQQRQRLRNIKRFDQLIAFLRDELDWPIEQGHDEEDLTFDWSDDLGLKESERVGIKEIKQLRPLETGQPWGIFFVNFEKKQLPIVILRRILNSLVMKKRAGANKAQQAAWKQHDLLFISAYGEDADRQLTFAHFSEPNREEDSSKATLRVLGWDDDDTNLKLDHVADQLKTCLTWPKDPNDVPAWRKRWAAAFELRPRQVIDTAEDLALRLAELAKRIRNRMLLVLPRESESGELRKLLKGFKTALIHDLNEAQFADMYAQTITYGLFSAAVSRTVPGAGTAVVQGNVVDMIPVTNPFLKEMLQSFLKAGGRKNKLDFDELGIQEVVDLLNDPKTHLGRVLDDFGNRTRGEDPVIHFYENFLAAYDKKLKVQRGVFYTPQPVVSYIVRSVHELLQTEFGLEDGLSDTTTWGEMLKKRPGLKLPPLTSEPGEKRTISPDEPFVQILDPATGTATFLVEVIDVMHRTMMDKWAKQGLNEVARIAAWNEYVPKHLLPRVHAFELMMAPYAIAHMKIGLKLADTGYSFGAKERARIYLTNALEPWQKQLQLPDFSALAHEAAAVNEIKREKRFTVVIGNPPYSLYTANLTEEGNALIKPFRFVAGEAVRERGALQLEKNLQDDYVKFFGLARSVLKISGVGALGFISNHGYLNNRTLRGMRFSLVDFFNKAWILELHGSASRSSAKTQEVFDQNIFDIQQGVAVGIFSRANDVQSGVLHEEVLGLRTFKYDWLIQHKISDIGWKSVLPSEPYYLLEPRDADTSAEYRRGVSLDEAFPVNSTGIVSARDGLVVQFSRSDVESVIARLSKQSAEQARLEFELGDDTKDWAVARAQKDIKDAVARNVAPTSILYRPFDTRWTYYTGQARGFMCNPRRPVMAHLLDGTNLALCTNRQVNSEFRHVGVSRGLVTDCTLSTATKERTYVFPLYLSEHSDSLLHRESRRLNLSASFLDRMASALGFPPNPSLGLPSGLTPEDIFHYTYAVFHSPGYRSRYAEFLKIDFPRLPLTGNLDLFRALTQLGGELVALHLLESSRLDKPVTEFIGTNTEVTKVGYSDGTVWIDAGGTRGNVSTGTSGFRGVPEDVWNFHFGGYQVCEKWLRDRKGRLLSAEDIRHYHRIVVSLRETIRLMSEIERLIDERGGWPGAFASTSADPSVEVAASEDVHGTTTEASPSKLGDEIRRART